MLVGERWQSGLAKEAEIIAVVNTVALAVLSGSWIELKCGPGKGGIYILQRVVVDFVCGSDFLDLWQQYLLVLLEYCLILS